MLFRPVRPARVPASFGNVDSRRVAEKAGFLIEATLRARLRHRGTRVDAWVGSLLRPELP